MFQKPDFFAALAQLRTYGGVTCIYFPFQGLVGRIEIVTSSIEEYIKDTHTRFDKVSSMYV